MRHHVEPKAIESPSASRPSTRRRLDGVAPWDSRSTARPSMRRWLDDVAVWAAAFDFHASCCSLVDLMYARPRAARERGGLQQPPSLQTY